MKQIAILILFVGCLGCRTIQGEYYESFGAGWGGADYHFSQDGSFSYRSQYDVGGDTGTGTYKARFGRIRFDFDSIKATPAPSANIKFVHRSNDDSSRELTISVFDENGLELPGAIVTVRYAPVTVAGLTNVDGVVRMVLDSYVDSVFLTVRYCGFHNVDISVSAKSFQGVNVRMVMSWDGWTLSIDSGTVWKFKFRPKRTGVILLKKTSYSFDYNDDYKREFIRNRQIIMLIPK